ncbi:hypothetical protein GCM10017559_22620 [Streptosporangium longisporum]|uniref:Uncharacterized protein n=1 Tax=Streptosporangium longisporum TaxID=46187 RepID=A0ABN3XVM6_9ACTN
MADRPGDHGAGVADQVRHHHACRGGRRFPGAVFSRAGHDLTTGVPADECVRATLRTFLAEAVRCPRVDGLDPPDMTVGACRLRLGA